MLLFIFFFSFYYTSPIFLKYFSVPFLHILLYFMMYYSPCSFYYHSNFDIKCHSPQPFLFTSTSLQRLQSHLRIPLHIIHITLITHNAHPSTSECCLSPLKPQEQFHTLYPLIEAIPSTDLGLKFSSEVTVIPEKARSPWVIRYVSRFISETVARGGRVLSIMQRMCVSHAFRQLQTEKR